MAKLSRPRKYDLHLLRDWLARPKGGNNFLGPGEDRPWVEGTENDLVAISKSNYDSLTYWVEERVVPWAARCGILRRQPVRGYEAVGLREWSDTTFFAMSKTFSIVMSTAIPSAAIIALYSIHHMLHRILAASLLTLVFSVALAVTTSARPAELFVATAAYVLLKTSY